MNKTIMDSDKKLEVHLTEHCNLNCSNCCHFSQIAEEGYLDPTEYEKSLEKIDKHILNYFDVFHLVGGEPLLNKNINEIITITRKYFDKKIRLITNCVRLEFMNPDFFKLCEEENIDIAISNYPTRFNRENVINKLSSKYRKLSIYYYNVETLFYKHKFDLEGKQDKEENFRICWVPNRSHCIQLVDTKAYICSYGAYIKHFNKRFGCNLICDDFIDLSNVKNVEEIDKWINEPKEFCKYCILYNNENVVKWKPYKRWENDYL